MRLGADPWRGIGWCAALALGWLAVGIGVAAVWYAVEWMGEDLREACEGW